MSLRERNRMASMRTTQRIALEQFSRSGFDAVTVEQIASEAGMAASTVFRHFGTKEQLVLWDEHVAMLERSLGRRLGKQSPLSAICEAFIETLASCYEEDLAFQLSRVKFIYATPALHAAAIEADYAARTELSAALGRVLSKQNAPAAGLLAGAALLALDVAIERWQAKDAKLSLADCIADAFADLARLDTLE